VPSARSDRFDGRRQCAVPLLDLAQRGFAIGAVDIDDKDSRRLASGDGDIEIGLLLPPAPDDGRISTVASLQPWGVAGTLSRGRNVKTCRPRFANASA
jgi:hypothetical protein